jgi:hypothetical protein
MWRSMFLYFGGKALPGRHVKVVENSLPGQGLLKMVMMSRAVISCEDDDDNQVWMVSAD